METKAEFILMVIAALVSTDRPATLPMRPQAANNDAADWMKTGK